MTGLLLAAMLAAQIEQGQTLSRAALLAPLPPDSAHPFARRLRLAFDDTLAGRAVLVVVHRGADSLPGNQGYSADREVVAVQRAGTYQVLQVIEPAGYWETENAPHGPYWNTLSFIDTAYAFHYGSRKFLRIAEKFYGTGAAVLDHILTLDASGRLVEVETDDADQRFRPLLRPGESQIGGRFTVADDRIEFQAWIMGRGDPECCPTAGTIRARYRITGDDQRGFRMAPDSVWREAIKEP